MQLYHRILLSLLSFDESLFYPVLEAGPEKGAAGLLSDNRLLYREVVKAQGSDTKRDLRW